MAPTEVLARQHFESHRQICRRRGPAPRPAHRPRQGAARARTLAALADGRRSISSIGTHALFQESVAFRDLGLAVVDEQHRFGVHQRLALGAKGRRRRYSGDDRDAHSAHAGAHLFRRHGCLDLARKAAGPPADRDPRAAARAHRRGRRAAAGRAIGDGARAYWVCPLVEESEALDVAAARGALCRAARRFSATRSASCTAR